MTQDFEGHLSREILRSERQRMAVLASLFGLLVVVFPIFAWVFHSEYEQFFHSYAVLYATVGLSGGLVAYELFTHWVLGRLLARGGMPPTWLRFFNAFVETSVPSLLIFLAARDLNPMSVLQGPAALLYGVFIVLSTLRLDFALSVFTGLVAAAEFTALSFFYAGTGNPAELGSLGMLATPGFILMKGLVLALSGVAAGFVAAQLRRRIGRTFRALQERERVISAFGQQVSPQIVEELLKRGPEIASRRSFVCVMFMDVRDFTTLVEGRSPEEIVALQNEVFGAAVEVINRHHGVINQFLGDGLMATFGAPLSSGNDCANALAAARELISRIKVVKIGIGLHAGDAVTGNVGSAERKQYSVTGNVVILASRIEQLNKEFDSQLLVSREVLERTGEEHATSLGAVRVKGREQPIEIYKVA
jgi:adenylate cyclase